MRSLCLVLLFSLLALPAHAHKISLVAFLDSGQLSVQAFFANGTACGNCPITVSRPDGSVLASDRTDAEGAFNLQLTEPGDVIVQVDGGSGHRAEATVHPQGAEPDPAALADAPAPQNADAIRSIVREELARQTAEIAAYLEKDKSPVSRILSGLGYLVGIFGLLAFWKGRK